MTRKGLDEISKNIYMNTDHYENAESVVYKLSR